MERTQIFELMSELRLSGMKAAYDEIMATAIKRQHEPPRIVGDLLQAEVNEKQARSIKYQIRIAKLPLAKDLNDFEFEGTPINERLVRDLAQGDFLAEQRNCVLVGGTGTGKTHLAIAIARSCIRWQTWPLLQHRRSCQPARGRGARRPPRTDRRISQPAGLRCTRRTRLSALCPDRRPAAIPSDQSAL
jgi:hypothetical protein